MDDFEEDNKYKDVMQEGAKTKSTWNAGEQYYKTLGRCKEAFFQYNQEGEIVKLFWLIRGELSMTKPFLIKKSELILRIKQNLDKAEGLLFSPVNKGNMKNINTGLSLKYLHDAWDDLNTLEAVNGLLQPIGKSPEQKIHQYGG
jgi:hypothetical protein